MSACVWWGMFLREASRKVCARFHLLPWGAEGTKSLGEELCLLLLLLPMELAGGTCSEDGMHMELWMMPWEGVLCCAGEARWEPLVPVLPRDHWHRSRGSLGLSKNPMGWLCCDCSCRGLERGLLVAARFWTS